MRRIMLCPIVLFISCMQKNPAITGNSGEKIDALQINQFVIQEQGDRYTLLGSACKNNDINKVEKLLRAGADIHLAKTDDIYEFHALYVAIENNHVALADYILTEDVDINRIYTEEGLTPLTLACKLNRDLIAEKLIPKEANVNGIISEYSEYTLTPLLVALENNNFSLTKRLLEKGANVDVQNEAGDDVRSIGLRKGGKWVFLFDEH